MKKYKYDELMIEITRKCNLACENCLRGDAQNITMSKEVIDRIFEDAPDCKQVLFTGGEPLLAINEIGYFIDKLIASDWTTSNIAMTINGTICNPKIIDIANKFCQSRSDSTFHIIISDDEFHDKGKSESALKFYQDCECENGVRVLAQEITLVGIKQEFTLAGRAIDYYKNHPTLDEKWVVKKEEQTNHRLCILNDNIPCAMYVTVSGGFESYVGEDFDTVDKLSYGSILQSSMSELVDRHNESCVVSCHDAYLINYFNNLAKPDDLLSELVVQVNLDIMNRFIAAREKARKLYPLVSAYAIITNIPMPDLLLKTNDIYRSILESEHLTDNEIAQYVGMELISKVPTISNDDTLQQAYKELLQILAVLKKPNAVIAPDKVYGSGNLEETLEFRKLSALNYQYATGELYADNSTNIQCSVIYGKSFRDYEVEKIQNSDLPDQIKLGVLREDELERELSRRLESEWKEFVTGFTKDFKEGMRRAIKKPYDSPIYKLRAELQTTINDLKKVRSHMNLLKHLEGGET